jgi:hypothetical protein
MVKATKPFSEEFNDGANPIKISNKSSWTAFTMEQNNRAFLQDTDKNNLQADLFPLKARTTPYLKKEVW